MSKKPALAFGRTFRRRRWRALNEGVNRTRRAAPFYALVLARTRAHVKSIANYRAAGFYGAYKLSRASRCHVVVHKGSAAFHVPAPSRYAAL